MTNRADIATADSPITAFAIKQSGGKPERWATSDAAPYGIVVPNDQADFAAALSRRSPTSRSRGTTTRCSPSTASRRAPSPVRVNP
jgi:polar amino acid transport system substrate-binding protein